MCTVHLCITATLTVVNVASMATFVAFLVFLSSYLFKIFSFLFSFSRFSFASVFVIFSMSVLLVVNELLFFICTILSWLTKITRNHLFALCTDHVV